MMPNFNTACLTKQIINVCNKVLQAILQEYVYIVLKHKYMQRDHLSKINVIISRVIKVLEVCFQMCECL